jgi:ribonuclease HI
VQYTTELWTDGACSGNPGPGGWAYVLIARGADGAELKRLEGSGGDPHTTNNRMELAAALHGLRALRRPTAVTVCPDSSYLTNAFVKGWLRNWQRNGWRKRDKGPVENQDLWRELLEASDPHTLSWQQVKGHAHHELNNRCDLLAVHQRDIFAGRIPQGTAAPA